MSVEFKLGLYWISVDMLCLVIENLIVVIMLVFICLLGWINVDRGCWVDVIFFVIFMLG